MLLIAGYWPTTYFVESYWNNRYWPCYGGLGVIIDPTVESITVIRTFASKTITRVMDSITTDRDIEEK